jgi:multisubunit Na+/H+ antiporter MnhB subunit
VVVTTRAEQDAKALARRTKAARKGSEWYFFIQCIIGICVFALAYILFGRAFGWDKSTDVPSLIAMINDDGALLRAVVYIAILVAVLFAIGKPDKRPWWVLPDRIGVVLMLAGLAAVVYWFGWGGGAIP